jgi:isoleucyl-tRNA synthetase
MSKSLGNTIEPATLMRDYGADILRLWALTVDFTEDHRIGKEILAGTADAYRKLRNTFRYLLGALDGFTDSEKLAPADMPELERYVLHLLAEMDGKLRQAVEDFDFNLYVRLISDFANNDLSAFFFDIRKDSLYCDAATDPKRRAYRTVLDILFHALVRYAAPVLVFTAEEVWGTRYPEADSVHLLEWPAVDAGWAEPALGEKWATIRIIRTGINEAIEPLRREKRLGSSLEASVRVPMHIAYPGQFDGVDWAEVCIAAHVELVPATGEFNGPVSVDPTNEQKCARCWRHLPDVQDDLCGRCTDVVAHA